MNYKNNLLRTMVSVSVLLFAMPAIADERDSRINILEQQLQMMAQEIQALKQAQQQDRQAVNAMNKSVEKKIVEDVSKMEPAAGGSDVKITMKPVPKITSGGFSWQPTGRVHVDYASFSDDKRDHPNGAELRRARLGMKGNISKDLEYKIEVDFGNESVSMKDAYLAYTGIENTELIAGNFKPSMSLENNTSSNDITFIERSAPTSAFTFSEILGIGGKTHGEKWSLAAGLFNDDVGVQSSDDEAWAAVVRGTVAPILNNETLIHLGASATYFSPDQANDRFDFDAQAENALQSVDSVSANFTGGDSAQIYGLEAAAKWGAVSAQGEYYITNVEMNQGNNLGFTGGYVQGSWVLTGESRPYNIGKGAFSGIKPSNPFDVQNNNWGAFEIAARYSTLDVSDENVLGGEMDNYTLALNWYLNDYARLMANYIIVDTDQNAVTPNDDPQILLLRSQVKF